MPVNIAQNSIYESYKMLDIDGNFLCYCNQKKAMWYISRNLANWTEEKVFKLNFEPKGKGKSDIDFYSQVLENKCVVCGSLHHLNKHHVVPYVFRSRLPVQYKSRNHHDIVPLCVDCHEEYESYANELKKELANNLGVKFNSEKLTQEEKHNKKILQAQITLEKVRKGVFTNIPQDRILELEKIASEPITIEFVTNHKVIWADKIVEDVLSKNNLFEFYKMWRKHFVDIMNPQFLPNYWKIDSPVEIADKTT
jgi:hypothetical protein